MYNYSKQLKNGLANATFADADVEAATKRLIDDLDSELTSAGYDEGTDVLASTQRLEDALTAFDTSKESRPEIDEEDVDDDDPFAGLEG